MLCVSLLLVLAVNAVDVDIVSLPLTNDVKVVLTPAGRGQLKRDGNVSQIRIDIDRITPATSLALLIAPSQKSPATFAEAI